MLTVLCNNSWDVGNAHFVIFSSEVYFYTEYGVELIGEQFNWLEEDLKVLSCTASLHTLSSFFSINISHNGKINS